MSFLIDPPWLYATGRTYGRLMPEQTPAARAVSRLTAGAFLATSISLYFDGPGPVASGRPAARIPDAIGCSTPELPLRLER